MKLADLKYGEFVSGDWFNPSKGEYKRIKGNFEGVQPDGSVHIRPDGEDAYYHCAPNSIRRLVRKRRRRYWIVELKSSIHVYPTFRDACVYWKDTQIIEVVEVRNKNDQQTKT